MYEKCKHFDEGFCLVHFTGANQLRQSKCRGCDEYCESSKELKQYYVRAGRFAAESLVSLDAEGLQFAKDAGYDIRQA